MAPANTARKVEAWMKENKVDLLSRAARSPDLNSIESIWTWMDKELVKVRIRSINNLKQELDTIWRGVPSEICNNLVKSMEKRCLAYKKARGRYFKYQF